LLPAIVLLLLWNKRAFETFEIGTPEKIRLANDARVHRKFVDRNIHLGVIRVQEDLFDSSSKGCSVRDRERDVMNKCDPPPERVRMKRTAQNLNCSG